MSDTVEKYVVFGFRHEGKRYFRGDKIKLSKRDADRLEGNSMVSDDDPNAKKSKKDKGGSK